MLGLGFSTKSQLFVHLLAITCLLKKFLKVLKMIRCSSIQLTFIPFQYELLRYIVIFIKILLKIHLCESNRLKRDFVRSKKE